jgi:hypothetical protein
LRQSDYESADEAVTESHGRAGYGVEVEGRHADHLGEAPLEAVD